MPGFKYLTNLELVTPEFLKQRQVLLKDDDTQGVNLFGVFVGPVSSGSGALTGCWLRGCDLIRDLCLGLSLSLHALLGAFWLLLFLFPAESTRGMLYLRTDPHRLAVRSQWQVPICHQSDRSEKSGAWGRGRCFLSFMLLTV